jgi:hypothetical protein
MNSVGAPEARAAARAAVICAALFMLAAMGIAALQAAAPITRGWWLAAYLALVGGLSQVLLVGGLIALAIRPAVRTPGAAVTSTHLALWNIGTVIVAVMDLAGLQAGVLLGGAALGVALLLFGRSLHHVMLATPRPGDRWWSRGYALLLFALGCSVVVGVLLAG